MPGIHSESKKHLCTLPVYFFNIVACGETGHTFDEILGADPRILHIKYRYGQTILHVACENRQHGSASRLIDAGVDIDAVDHDGYTALHLAIKMDDKRMFELLIDRGANMDKGTFANGSPLSMAIRYGRQDIVELLIERGAKRCG